MKIVIFSDIHGNLPALETMLKDAGDADQYICLGDVVNYGPWSNECVDVVSSLKRIVLIEGNHEQYFIANAFPAEKNPIARLFFNHCRPMLGQIEKIANLPLEHRAHNFVFTHTLDEKNIYPDTPINIIENFFIGHSHHQFKAESNGHILVNAGSVGQNRKHINVVNYLIFFPFEQRVQLRSRIYDEKVVLSEMRRLRYPSECYNYYNDKSRATDVVESSDIYVPSLLTD